MSRKFVFLTALAASVAVASPAMAWNGWNYNSKPKPTAPSSSSGGTKPSSSGGSHSVPEPGVLGLMGAGLIGLGLMRRRRKTND